MSSMKVLIKEDPMEGYNLKEIPIPKPERDEVLIKIEKVAICGSDIALYVWNDVAKVIATLPFIPGHEATGTVAKCGPESNLKVGDRVAVENHFFCGNCYTCKDGRGDICKQMDQYGHGRGTMHGGFSQFSIAKSKYCYRLKTDITPCEAVLLEPMGVAYNGIEGLGVKDKDVLIIGAGPIGLLGTAICKALGARRVMITDINPDRLTLAEKMGADIAINSAQVDLHAEVMRLTDGNGVERLVEASGASAMVNTCFTLLRKGAHLVLIGLPKQAIHVEDPLQNVVFKSLTLTTVHGRRIWDTWEKCEQLIAKKKVDPNLIVSHNFGMTEWQSAFDVLMSGKCCKIVINPQA